MSKADDQDEAASRATWTRRDALAVLGGAGVAALVGCGTDRDDATSAVARAEQDSPPVFPVLQGYPWPPSVRQGTSFEFHVSTTSAFFVIDFYREGPLPPQFMGRSPVFAGVSSARGKYDSDWQWPAYPVSIPAAWPSGAYVAVLRRSSATGAPLDPLPSLATANGEVKVLFAVRSAAPATASTILYKLPLFTYQAYNATEEASLYADPSGTRRVTLRRAGGGTGHGEPLFLPCEPDPLGTEGDLQWQTFEKWDAKFIRWLEREQIAVEYCTDWDVDADPALLLPYRLLLSVGHDEYWSSNMRDHVEAFVAMGGNLACFSGNTCFWRVDVTADDAIYCNKVASAYQWRAQALPGGDTRTENYLTGVGFYSAGGKWNGGETCVVAPREQIGYTTHNTDFWVFRGTGLTAGAVFGQPQSLIGYEADGAQLDREARLLFGYRTPDTFHLLGHAFLPRTWARLVPSIEDDEVVNDPSYPYEVAAATMGLYNRNGTVFTAATTDWVRVVAGGEPSVQQITRNVLGRLKSRVSGRSVLGPVADAFSVGCYAGNDGFDHAIVAAAGGDIHELYWQSGHGVGQGVLASIPGALAVAGFQGSDGYQHAIVAATDGIHEIYWQSGQGVHQGVIGQVSIPIAVAGFTSADGVQHAIVAAGNGDIHEFYWGGGVGLHHEVIANIPSPRAVAGYFAAVDGRSHVIVSDAANRVHELYWLPAGAVGHGVIATFDHQVIGVGGHYTSTDSQQHVVVAVGDGNVYELAWHSADGVVRDVLPSMATPARTSMAVALASYVSSDGVQHAIAAGSDGTMHELYWRP